MYVLDHFIFGKLQLTTYRDQSSKVGVLGGEKLKTQEKLFKSTQNHEKRSGAPWRIKMEVKWPNFVT